MSSLLKILPGIELPVSQVTSTLASMWQVESADGNEAPSQFRASQMNLILHFGIDVPSDDALEQFNTVIKFAQRYPCRIIVLCPQEDSHSEELLVGKLYSRCFIGAEHRDMCCCEALMLGYLVSEPDFLENQISIWLEGDLPVYYWFYKVPAERIDKNYKNFLRSCRRVVYDSSLEGESYKKINWPSSVDVSDLAQARILPIRQTLGQFLSSYSPDVLVNDLKSVRVNYNPIYQGDAQRILLWLNSCFGKCSEINSENFKNIEFKTDANSNDNQKILEIEWEYTDSKHFSWQCEENYNSALVKANFGSGEISLPFQIKHLQSEDVLAEALFF